MRSRRGSLGSDGGDGRGGRADRAGQAQRRRGQQEAAAALRAEPVGVALHGDDGLALPGRSSVAAGFDLASDTRFYYVVLALCVLAFLGIQRLLNARFGHVLQALRENETRMGAIGFPAYRHQLVAFTLAGGLAGLAGALLANQSGFVSPALLQWNQSGLLLVMVILGGVGHLWGGVVGAVVFLLLEEVLSAHTLHWQFALGAVLLAVVLAAPRGLAGWRRGRSA